MVTVASSPRAIKYDQTNRRRSISRRRHQMNRRFVIASLFVLLIASTRAHAEIKTQEIDYKHGDLELQGFLAYDDAIQGKRPGALVIPEWWGHDAYVRRRATDLAKLGYVAFAI